MDKDFASLFGKWIQDPDDEEANLLLHDILVDNGQEQIAKQFSKKEFIVYTVFVYYWSNIFHSDLTPRQVVLNSINEIKFSTMAEAKAFIQCLIIFSEKSEDLFFFDINKEELISKVINFPTANSQYLK